MAQHASAFAIRDGFPVSDGHTLVIPRRHAATYFDVTDDERRDPSFEGNGLLGSNSREKLVKMEE